MSKELVATIVMFVTSQVVGMFVMIWHTACRASRIEFAVKKNADDMIDVRNVVREHTEHEEQVFNEFRQDIKNLQISNAQRHRSQN